MTNYEYGITLISLVLTAIWNDLFGIDLRNDLYNYVGSNQSSWIAQNSKLISKCFFVSKQPIALNDAMLLSL